MKKKRYYVDKRVGCIAVRDRNKYTDSCEGLNSEGQDVVRFWHGDRVKKLCSTCGHETLSSWNIKDEDIVEAYNLCKKLNSKSSERKARV